MQEKLDHEKAMLDLNKDLEWQLYEMENAYNDWRGIQGRLYDKRKFDKKYDDLWEECCATVIQLSFQSN